MAKTKKKKPEEKAAKKSWWNNFFGSYKREIPKYRVDDLKDGNVYLNILKERDAISCLKRSMHNLPELLLDCAQNRKPRCTITDVYRDMTLGDDNIEMWVWDTYPDVSTRKLNDEQMIIIAKALGKELKSHMNNEMEFKNYDIEIVEKRKWRDERIDRHDCISITCIPTRLKYIETQKPINKKDVDVK